MFRRTETVTERIETLIGRRAHVHGDVEFEGGLHLDGRVTGNVRAVAGSESTVSVSEHGCVEGSIEASNVVLNGAVRGDVRGRLKVVLGAQSRVHGDVYYGVIEMAPGAEITGRLVPVSAPGAGPGEAPET